MPQQLIPVEQALEKVLTASVSRQTIEIDTADCLGYVLAKTLSAPMSLPSFPQSAMDGYAVSGISETYNLVGEAPAGKAELIEITSGEAVRIFTGGAVPEGSTAVIMQEKVQTESENRIRIEDEVVPNKNIRPVGEQINEGDLLFEEGHQLNAAAIGLLVSMGISSVPVYKKPIISMVSTGNELVQLGKPLEYGQIYESNSYTLINAAKTYNYDVVSSNQVKDDYESTRDLLEAELENHDVLLISGGISVGDYDFVGKALNEIGVETIFYKVKQKPGKPLFFGRVNEKFVFALPGNPAAALSCFHVYVLPLLNRLSGKSSVELTRQRVPISGDFSKSSARSCFLKANYDLDEVTALEGQASSMLHSFSQANCLIYLPENVSEIKKGEPVEILLF